MFAIGNDELKQLMPLKKGDLIECKRCGYSHAVELGTSEDGQESDLIMFINCGTEVYLVGVQGKSLQPSDNEKE